jgi:hypothetical protein
MEIAKLILEYVKALAWPLALLVAVFSFRREIRALLSRLRKAALPGGVTLDFPEEVEAARSLSEEVRKTPEPPKRGAPLVPITEANARLLSLRLAPSPSGLDFNYYRKLAEQDPNLALAGLRMELEIMARNLAMGFKVPFNEKVSAGRLLGRLFDVGAVTSQQYELGESVLRLCNAAVHGTGVTIEEATSVIDVADALREQYLNWLSWGFGGDWKQGAGPANRS